MEQSEYFQIERVEETHFWYRAMEKLALDTIQQAFPHGCSRILDVGCGPGGMTQKLTRFGPTAGIDLGFENKLLQAINLPFGSSVICIASKTENSTFSGFAL